MCVYFLHRDDPSLAKATSTFPERNSDFRPKRRSYFFFGHIDQKILEPKHNIPREIVRALIKPLHIMNSLSIPMSLLHHFFPMENIINSDFSSFL